MTWRSKTISFWLNKWPGRKYLGLYRFLPIFFILGATLEFSMISWEAGNANFYKVYKRRRAQEIALQKVGES